MNDIGLNVDGSVEIVIELAEASIHPRKSGALMPEITAIGSENLFLFDPYPIGVSTFLLSPPYLLGIVLILTAFTN